MARRFLAVIFAALAALIVIPAATVPASAIDRQRGGVVRIGEVIAGSPLWAEWARRYLQPSGRVVDTAARGVSHSEGQGYGMLLAVAAGDRPAFDRIWGWARANLAVRSDNLLAWRWDPEAGAVSDRNNATDGDMLVAWALAEAADLWKEADYAAAATAMAADISRQLVVDAVGVGPVLLPAGFGFARADQPDGPVVNLSYWVFPAFARLEQLAPEANWGAVRRSGLAIIDAIQSQANAGVTNWTALGDGRIAPARRFPAKVGYDAARIPLYLAFAPSENADRLARFASMFPPAAGGLPIVDLRSGNVDEIAAGPGYRAIAALRACAVSGQPFPRDLYRLGGYEPYYPATLHALALVAALISHDECLDPIEASRLQPLGWTRRLAKSVAAPAPARVVVQPSPAIPSATPTVFAQAPDSAETDDATGGVLKFGAPLGAALALFGFIAISRRFRPRVVVEDSTPAVLRERSPAPRNLPENPFQTVRGERALEERLDIAARASWNWQRTAAVAYFRLQDHGEIVAAEGAEAAQRCVAALAAALSARVRKSDAVSTLAPDEIVVCLSLIADEVDLASVGRRLTAAMREARALPGGENLFGLALYETDATGAQCLADARRAFADMNPPLQKKKQGATSERAAPRRRPRAKASI